MERRLRPQRSLEWIGAVVVLAAALRYWLWCFDRTNLLDEGSTAAQALRILNGASRLTATD